MIYRHKPTNGAVIEHCERECDDGGGCGCEALSADPARVCALSALELLLEGYAAQEVARIGDRGERTLRR